MVDCLFFKIHSSFQSQQDFVITHNSLGKIIIEVRIERNTRGKVKFSNDLRIFSMQYFSVWSSEYP
jgi:hypothetical protein